MQNGYYVCDYISYDLISERTMGRTAHAVQVLIALLIVDELLVGPDNLHSTISKMNPAGAVYQRKHINSQSPTINDLQFRYDKLPICQWHYSVDLITHHVENGDLVTATNSELD